MATRSSAEPLVARGQEVSAAQPAADANGLTVSFVMFAVATFIQFARPQDFFPALAPLRLALVTTVIAGVLTWVRPNASKVGVFEAKGTKLYFLFYAAMVAGIPFSVYRPGSFDAVIMKYPLSLAFFVLFLVHVDSLLAMKRITFVLLLSSFLLTAQGVLNGQSIEGRFDVGSLMYDPNDVAFVELSLLALSVWVLAGPFRLATKLVAGANVGGSILLILLTASRGGLLGLLAFGVLFLCLRVKGFGKLPKIVMVAAVVVITSMNIDKINVDRLSTLNSIESDYNLQDDGGRVDIWQRGFTLFLRRPITGVGVDGFGKAIGDMRAAEFGEIPEWQTAHSSYVLVLTETGLLGSIPFLLLLIYCVVTFARNRRSAAAEYLSGLPSLLLVGLGAQLVSAAFLSQSYSVFFTLTFALAAAVNRIAQHLGDSVPAAAPQKIAFNPRTRLDGMRIPNQPVGPEPARRGVNPAWRSGSR